LEKTAAAGGRGRLKNFVFSEFFKFFALEKKTRPFAA
jgi:hypothetical protein